MPFFGYWAAKVKFGTALVEAWLPGEDSAKSTYRAFRDQFGDDQFLIISWHDCTLSDPKLPEFAQQLQQLADEQPELAIRRVENSLDMLRQLTDGPLGLEQADAERRLRGFAIGRDGSCFIAVQVQQAQIEHRAELISNVESIAEAVLGGSNEMILAGEPFQVYMIDRASRETMQYFVVPSSLVALLFAWCCLRQIRLTLLVFTLSGIGQLIGLALVSYFLGEVSAVLVVLPTLIFMLTLSAAIHLTNYYLDATREHDHESAGAGPGPGKGKRPAGSEESNGIRALSLGARPCILATLTTVFGFFSLAVSSLAPVWQFGSLAALGLLISSAILLSVFPAASQIGEKSGDFYVANRSLLAMGMERWLARVTGRFAIPLTSIGLTLLLFAALGIFRLQTSTEFDDMFAETSESVQSLRWVQEHIGPIHALEFLVSFPAGAGANTARADLLGRIQNLRRFHHQLGSAEGVQAVMSAVTFLPELPEGSGLRSTIRRAVLRRKLELSLPELQNRELLSVKDGMETWRVSARIADMRGDNYVQIRDRLVELAEAALIRTNGPQEIGVPSASLELTGLRTVVEKAHYALLTDLSGSFATAFLLITPVMMVIVRGVWSGLLLMIPNVLPVAFVFGCMGWLGVRLDVASILTASVALGIAVDDTLHFVSWFLRGRRQGLGASDAVSAAIEACARPMLHTTIICTGAMLPFFFSSFLPTSKFALLMILILSGAILGDLILLPAMLQSPLGKLVGRKHETSGS